VTTTTKVLLLSSNPTTTTYFQPPPTFINTIIIFITFLVKKLNPPQKKGSNVPLMFLLPPFFNWIFSFIFLQHPQLLFSLMFPPSPLKQQQHHNFSYLRQNPCRSNSSKLFWTRQKDLRPIYLVPIQFKAQTPSLEILLATYPSTARGVHGASKTGSNEPQRLFARSRNNLSGGYTSHDFVTTRPRCAITTALQPSTSIYRGLLAVPKVESILPLNPHSLISTNLSVGAPAGTHTSVVPRSTFNAFYHHSNHRIQSTDNHLLIKSISGAVCGNYKLSPFLSY